MLDLALEDLPRGPLGELPDEPDVARVLVSGNVNITLLFSIERYEQVIDAYLRGLAARAESGARLHTVSSVASFFLSRIDTNVDQRLPEGSPLRGRVALACARVAYQRYLANFAGPEWETLEGLGARRQRPRGPAPERRIPTTRMCATSRS